MKFERLVHSKRGWLRGTGPESDIVFSSRVRVARNLSSRLFPSRATSKEKTETMEEILAAVKSIPHFRNSTVLPIEGISEIDKQLLVERNLISRELSEKKAGSAVVIDSKEVVSVMINEEDHVRLQALLPGLCLEKCWEIVSEIDDRLDATLGFAFSPQVGYLTACPTNAGTGIRVSAMLHLPGLILSKQIDAVLRGVSQMFLAVRGIYGEGTEAVGNLFQFSNQRTLGKEENEIISGLENTILQVIKSERNARHALLRTEAESLYDKVGRAYGILTGARIITSKEAIDLLSTLRMGVDLEVIGELDRQAINELFVLTQPAHLQRMNGRELDPRSRDIERGSLLRSRLTKTKQ
jgi:protein arginine kinase